MKTVNVWHPGINSAQVWAANLWLSRHKSTLKHLQAKLLDKEVLCNNSEQGKQNIIDVYLLLCCHRGNFSTGKLKPCKYFLWRLFCSFDKLGDFCLGIQSSWNGIHAFLIVFSSSISVKYLEQHTHINGEVKMSNLSGRGWAVDLTCTLGLCNTAGSWGMWLFLCILYLMIWNIPILKTL